MKIISTYIEQYQGTSKEASMALIAFLFYAFSYASIIFLPLYLHVTLHQTLPQTGISLGAFGIGAVVAAFYGGKLCDRFSAYLISKLVITLYFLSLVLVYYIIKPYWLLLMILTIFGMANAAYSPSSRIYLMRLTPPADQAHVNGIRYMLFNIGTAISFGITGLIIHAEYQRVFIYSALCALSSTLFFSFLCKSEKHVKSVVTQEKGNILENKFLLIMLIYFFLGVLVFMQVNSSYSIFLLTNYHLSSSQLSSLFILNSLIIAAFQVAILRYFNTVDKVLLFCIGSLIIGIGFFILLFGHSFFTAVISLICWTFGEMLFIPISQTVIYQKANDSLKGYYMGIYQALFAISIMISPLFGSFSLHIDASGTLLWSTALILCAFPLFSYLNFRKR